MRTEVFNKRLLKYLDRVEKLRAEVENEFGVNEKLTINQEERIDGLLEALDDAIYTIRR